MSEHEEKKSILIVDDDDYIADILFQTFNMHDDGFYEVCIAKNFEIAQKNILSQYHNFGNAYDLYILDINIGGSNGYDLVSLIRDYDLLVPIIMFSGRPDLFRNNRQAQVSACVEKPVSLDRFRVLASKFIKNKHNKLPELFKKQFGDVARALELSSISIDDKDDTEGVEAWTHDARLIKFVGGYQLPEHEPNTFTIAVANCVGCVGSCEFCGSAVRDFKRNLTVSELLAQLYYGLDSGMAHSVCMKYRNMEDIKVRLAFTCEGDPIISNLDNTAQAIDEVKKLPFLVESVMTTKGSKKSLQLILEKYINKLKGSYFYWSLNFLDPELRMQYMPSTKKDNIYELRDLFCDISRAIGTKIVISILGMRSNLTAANVQKLEEFLCAREEYFTIKIQKLECAADHSMYTEVPTEEELMEFSRKLHKADIKHRMVHISGFRSNSGCGSTVPKVFKN